MPSVAKFIRNTPAASLRTYFEQTGIDIPMEIDWDGWNAMSCVPCCNSSTKWTKPTSHA